MDTKERVRSRLEDLEGRLIALSRWMYENPEVAYQEHESSRRLVELLSEAGFEVEYPAFGLETAFAARAGSGPEVVVCAEYDALPGIGHACGHNIIAAAGVGTGAALAGLAEDLGAQVTVLGTPAEEHFGGKVDLIEAGAFQGAAAAMMIHPSPRDVVDPLALAVAHVDLEYRGRSAHASAYPQEGVNALDAFVQAYVNVSTLRQHLYPTDKIHGIIAHGGDAPNIIPERTRSSWYVRAATTERLTELKERVFSCFEAGARATGCTYEVIPVGHDYDDIVSDPVLVELFADNAERLGRKMLRGTDLPVGTAGSTDMGNVSHLVPTIHPMLDINPGSAVNHQPEFAAHTITEDGERAIRDGALAMAWTIVDLAEGDRWAELSSPGR